ncbi:MAG: DUF6504 family protein [Nocardioidaceae bacterium]
MRRYDEDIDVRQGLVSGQEAPEQFLWRERLWVVREIIAHWIETGAWWEQPGVAALLDVGSAPAPAGPGGADLLAEREVWRVEAARGARAGQVAGQVAAQAAARTGWGVFDLTFDWGGGRWQLATSVD